MANFLLLVVAATVVAAIGFGIAAFTLGRDRGLTPPRPDGAPFDLPTDRPLTGGDVRDLRLDTAVRGYRMGQVDVLLDRVGHDLDVLWRHLAALEDEIADLRRSAPPYRPSTNGSVRAPAGPPEPGMPPAADASEITRDDIARDAFARDDAARIAFAGDDAARIALAGDDAARIAFDRADVAADVARDVAENPRPLPSAPKRPRPGPR